MANVAAFTIEGTPSEDPVTGNRGYTAVNSQVLDVTLEQNPSSVISITYEVFDSADAGSPVASKSAPAITWTSNGLARVTPANKNGTETIALPAAAAHSYIIRATASTDEGPVVFERLVSIFSGSLRKTVPAESQQFSQRAWSDALNDMVDALGGGGGGETLAQTLAFGSLTGGVNIQFSIGDAAVFLGEINVRRSGTTLIASDSSSRLLLANAAAVRLDNDTPVQAETTTVGVFVGLLTLSASDQVILGNGVSEVQVQFGTVLKLIDAGTEILRLSDSLSDSVIETIAGAVPRNIILRAGASIGANPGANLILQAGDSVSGTPGTVDLYADSAVRAQVDPSDSSFSVTSYAVRFTEVAAVPGGAPDPGQGKLWVRNDVPSTLVFTNDVGTDFVIVAASPADFVQGLVGAYDAAAVTGTFAPPSLVRTARTLLAVSIIRRRAGLAGITRVDILKNGVSVFALDANKPQVTAAAGDNAFNTTTTIATAAFAANDRVDYELEVVETALVDPDPGPADFEVRLIWA